MESLTRVNASAIALTLGTSDRLGAKIDVTVALAPHVVVEGEAEEEAEAVVAMDLHAHGGA